MNEPSLSADDLPLSKSTHADRMLRLQLEEATGRHFYKACDRSTQALLSSCDWYITINSRALILAIVCPDLVTNWRVSNKLVQIGNQLKQFSICSKIRVYPPIGSGTPFEMRVDDISCHRNSISGDLDS